MKGKFQILTSEYPYALCSFVRSAVSFRCSLAVVPTAIVLALVILLTALPAVAQSVVKETVLPNGLKVLTKEIHTTPVVSFNIWYKVGSRNEQLGKTGLSHLLEHMQFKGTKSFKKGEIDKLIRQNGGLSNAATWKDFTYYWETLSSDKLELAMRIEADRMTHSLHDPKEFEAERTVVLSELEGDENDPDYLLYYELYATAFKAHPYQWPTIGWQHDVETVTRDDLYAYYKTFYVPNNATIVIVGDFDTEKVLGLVRKHFGKIPRGPEPPKVTAKEPPQLGEKRAVVRKPGVSQRVMIGYHIPAIGHPDIYALDVLEMILSYGKSSRLYKALVDKQLATGTWASSTISRDPDLFILGATARDDVKIENVEAALLDEVERLKNEPITDQELQKALNQLEAQFVYANDSVTSQARQLGLYETIYTWRFVEEYLPNVRKVTQADVQRVAQKYLTTNNRSIVTFVPDTVPDAQSAHETTQKVFAIAYPAYRQASEGSASLAGTSEQHQGKVYALGNSSCKSTALSASTQARKSSPPLLEKKALPGSVVEASKPISPSSRSQAKVFRAVLENGLVVIVYENRSNPTVAIQGSINAGGMLDPAGKKGVASMTAELLTSGTAKRTAQEIAEEKDFHAIQLAMGAESEYASLSGYSLSKNFELLLDLMSDMLRNPSFPEEEFAKVKSRRLSEIRQEQDNPEALAFRAFYGSIFPSNHPYSRLSVEEELSNVSAITRDDVVSFYKNHYGPNGAVIVIVGDVDAQDAFAKIKKYFGDWKGGAARRPQIPDVPVQSTVQKIVIPMPGKSQVAVLLGCAGSLKRTDADFYAATVMNHILGGGGALGSRMGTVIRDDMGLVYNIYSTFDASLGAGPWYTYLGTNPKNVDRAIDAVVDQIAQMQEKGATKEEVKQAVDFIAGSFPARRLEKNSSIAETLHFAEIYGLGTDYLEKYQSLYRSVTVEQVNAAAKKYLHPHAYTLVIVGPVANAK